MPFCQLEISDNSVYLSGLIQRVFFRWKAATATPGVPTEPSSRPRRSERTLCTLLGKTQLRSCLGRHAPRSILTIQTYSGRPGPRPTIRNRGHRSLCLSECGHPRERHRLRMWNECWVKLGVERCNPRFAWTQTLAGRGTNHIYSPSIQHCKH